MPAPSATASSGSSDRSGRIPATSSTSACTAGMRVPPAPAPPDGALPQVPLARQSWERSYALEAVAAVEGCGHVEAILAREPDTGTERHPGGRYTGMCRVRLGLRSRQRVGGRCWAARAPPTRSALVMRRGGGAKRSLTPPPPAGTCSPNGLR